MAMPAVASPVIGVEAANVASKSAIVMKAINKAPPEKIIDMAMNESGVRDTSRVLGVSITTVIAHLKKIKARPRQSTADSSGDGTS